MKGKGKIKGGVSKGKWKPVPLDFENVTMEEMSGFVGLEEMTDYEAIHISRKGKITSRKIFAQDSDDDLEFPSDEEDPDKAKGNKAKKAKKRKTIDDISVENIFQENKLKPPRKKKKMMKSIAQQEHCSAEIKKTECDDKILEGMSSWDGLFVPALVLRALWEQGFTSPTPIQALTLPSAIRDRMDILGAAQTGSGKTLAFGIPIIHFILDDISKEEVKEKKLRALVLTPTRELAIQVQQHLLAAAKHTPIKIAVVVGGMAAQKQRRLLHRGPDIVVATPGRLWELIEEGEEHLNSMHHVRHLVIDEADRMAEKGHFAELEHIMNLIKRGGSVKRQTFVFSATLTMIHDTPQRLWFKKKKVKVTEQIKLDSIMSIVGMQKKPKIIDLSPKVGTAETLVESRIYCEADEKDAHLYYFWLRHPGRTLVFCNSIDCVRRLQSLLELLNCKPLCLHANMHQRQRLKNLDRFKSRDRCLLLASDVAARGLDIPNVQHVVHYQVPRTAEIYVHRSGRTARACNEGLSMMMVSPEEIQLYRKLARTLKRKDDLAEFPVDSSLYESLQERVSCARQLDRLQHQQNMVQAKSRWIQQAAKAFEIDIEEDPELSKTVKKGNAISQDKGQVQALRKRLNVLLSRQISPQGYYTRYPTQTGALRMSKSKNMKTAVSLMKSKKGKKVTSCT